MENRLAKALYDNTAECPDELAFRKGDIVTVMEQNVAGTSGWWMCSLYGRQGLAPANRLQLLRHSGPPRVTGADPKSADCQRNGSHQNIYQIPSLPRPSYSPAYESMDRIYKVPSVPLSTSKSPSPPSPNHSTEGTEGQDKSLVLGVLSALKGDVYDVPNQSRRASLFTPSAIQRQSTRKASLVPLSELEKMPNLQGSLRCNSPTDVYVYAVPPPLSQEPNYDIPVPSATEAQQRVLSGHNTLPNPRKQEWIYDVPLAPEKPGPAATFYGTMPSKISSINRQRYDAPPAGSSPLHTESPTQCLYDIPKSSPSPHQAQEGSSPPKVLPRAPIYDKPPAQKQTEDLVYAVPLQEHQFPQGLSSSHRNHIPLECRGDSLDSLDHTRVRLQRIRKVLIPASFRDRPGSGDTPQQEEQNSPRISTASSSSTSSCDSLALSSSSPEPLREVSLSQEEASRRLLELQEAVCKAVPCLMEFVSSQWRRREHLEKHLEEIRESAEGISCTVACFLSFALDVKGNARRLTDSNLQARIHKQLSIVEDSGVILQQTVSALGVAGWPLDTLSQDPGQVQTPDQLERFVMVARTLPEDIRRLVSILNANGKLLFKPQKEPEGHGGSEGPGESECPGRSEGPGGSESSGRSESPGAAGQPVSHQSPEGKEQGSDSAEDDNDYVQLQDLNQQSSGSHPGEEETWKPSLSEHCRLYFGALQKAIGGFVSSLKDGQPPERFISHSKLVIMVGQRLVDTLCKEAHGQQDSQSLLYRSNHLCALLKQLAVATKKAALHFPDQQALLEAQDMAKELAQRAQHFRLWLDI